ncbi:hypothetical protein Tco_1529317, partial [Tanacetum coccineum]
CHQKNQLAYEEKIRILKFDLEDKSNLLAYHEKLVANAAQEKQALQAKLDNELANTANWIQSSKNLIKLIDSSSWFTKKGDMHGVPPPMTGNYMPTSIHVEIDKSQFLYGLKQTNISETSFENVETFWTDAPIIEEVDSDNEYVVTSGKANEKPSHADNKSAKFINTPRDMGNKHDSRRHMGKQVGEGYAFPKKACFVCGSLSHLIKDCDFHEKRMAQEQAMAKQNEKTNGMVDLSSTRPSLSTPVPIGRQKFSKPVTTGRRNLPTPVPTGKAVPAGRPNYPIPVTSGRTNNIVRPFLSVFKPNRPNTQSASPSKRPLHRASPPKTSFSYFGMDKLKTVVKTSAGCSWSSSRYVWKKNTKNNCGSNNNNRLIDSGYSRSMTGNRHRLENFQEFKGGNVTFGGGEGKITGKDGC